MERHREWMAAHREADVELTEALHDWKRNYSGMWRKERHSVMLAMQREEILRHKWLESEKHHRDLGAEAVFDWIRRYAAPWRTWFERYEESPEEQNV